MKGPLPVHKYQARISSRFSNEKAIFSALNNEVNAAAARPTVTQQLGEEIDSNCEILYHGRQ